MAKTDNLTDFLISLADKIREHTGDIGTINPQDFEDKIDSIASSSGGNFVLPECKVTLDSNITQVMYYKYNSEVKDYYGYGALTSGYPVENPISVPWGSLIFLNPNNRYTTDFNNVNMESIGLESTFTAYRITRNGSIMIRR